VVRQEASELKKLLNLKKWLTVPEVSRHLSTLIGEDVSEADVLRLALDGHLTLSVDFVNDTECLLGPVVSVEDAKRDTQSLDKDGQHPIVGVPIDDGRVIECGTEIGYIRGVWDLPMIGAERVEIEARYQILTNGPAVQPEWWFSPVLLSQENGTYCQLVTRRTTDGITGEKLILTEPFHGRVNYHGALGLPTDAVLVVRTSALRDLEARMSEPAQRAEKPMGQRERTTLLVMIAALAKMADVDVNKPSSAAVAIEAQTALMGARVASRTIENHLKLIPEVMEDRSD
jgi:hypothetical protein